MKHILHIEYDTDEKSIKAESPQDPVVALGLLEYARVTYIEQHVKPQMQPRILQAWPKGDN